MSEFGWLDLFTMGIVLASVFIGVWRGAVYEILSLAGWLIAWAAAQGFGARAGEAWITGALSEPARHVAGWLAVFVAVLVVWRLLTWLVQRLLQATPLAPVDRGLGALFGLARGLVVVLALVLVVGATPLGRQPAWAAAPTIHWAHAMLAFISPALPETWRARTGGLAVPGRPAVTGLSHSLIRGHQAAALAQPAGIRVE